MPAPTNTLHQVDRLTDGQIAQFKRDGMLVLPGVLDFDLCGQAQDHLWDVIAGNRPGMKRDDPTTWVPFTEEAADSYQQRPDGGGDPYFFGRGYRLYVRNGAEELLLNAAVRPLWNVAEQLLGQGEVVWPAGVDEEGVTTGPCLLTERNVKGMVTHLGPDAEAWTGKATDRTGELRLPRTGPVWMTGQGARGLYCTLPNSPPPAEGYRGGHAEALYDTHWRLQIAAYINDVPSDGGGLILWPGSHRRIWDYWEAVHRDTPPPDRGKDAPEWDGYTVPPLTDIKADTEPTMTHGPAGSVVLWHANLLHMAGQNTRTDVIRQAAIYAFAKTPASVSDETVMRDPSGDLWRDWSDEVRAIEPS
jgi:hypothetical protein